MPRQHVYGERDPPWLGRAAHTRLVVCELRRWAIVQVDSSRHAPGAPGTPPGVRVILSLDAGQRAPGLRLPLEVQSMSPSGLAVLTAAGAAPQVDPRALGNPQEGDALTFVLEKDGRSTMLQASLVWLEVSSGPLSGQRLELIVDTGDQPGWREVESALAQE